MAQTVSAALVLSFALSTALASHQRVPRLGSPTSPINIEVESLAGAAQVTQGKAVPQDMRPFGTGWSGDAQLFWGGARIGSELRLVLTSAATGRYEIYLHFTRAPDYALVQASFDGAPAISFNGYAANVSRDRAFLGMLDLTPGTHELLIKVTMKDGPSKGLNVGLDRLEFVPVSTSGPAEARNNRRGGDGPGGSVTQPGEAAPLQPPPTRSTPQVNMGDSARAIRGARAGAPSGSVPVVVPATEPGPIGKGSAEGSLNDMSWGSFPQCAGSVPPAVEAGMKLLGTVLSGLGASAPTLDRRCGTYTREITSGVTLGAPFGASTQPPTWSFLGGRGNLMADSLLCLLKDIGDRPGGRIENRAAVTVGIGKVELRQIVGLSKFDPAAKRAELFQVTKICAPLLGCLDAGRQNIVATVRASAPAWPSGMRAGDYGIANSYAVEIVTDWSAVKASASLPPITVITPYGQVTAKPQFSYGTNLLPVDTPYAYTKGSQVQFHFPGALSVANETVQDTYGRSGVPFVLNVESHLPPQTPSRPAGWSSQLGLGGRDGSPKAQIWNPSGGSVLPFRPDLDFGKARSELERLPAASFVAKAPVRFEPPNPKSLLPGSVQSILSGVELWVEVTPAFLADYAAQFEMLSREARLTYGCLPFQGEFGRTCGVAETALALQATANAQIQITGTVHLKLSFIGVGPFTPPSINVTKSFTVPLPSPDRAWDPDHIENVQEAHQSSRGAWAIHAADKVGATLWQGVKGLSGATSDNLPQWTNACLDTPPKHPAPIPPPSHEAGAVDDLIPELLPCNICAADIRQTQYNPFLVFEVKNRKPGLPASVCEWQENAGCYDLCSWNGSSWNRVEMAATQVVGSQCATPRPPVVK